MEKALDGPVQGGGARGEHDGVADGEPFDVVAYLRDLARHVAARHYVVLDGIRVRHVGDGDVPVVQRYAAHLDEQLIAARARDGFFELLESIVAAALGPAEDGLGGHCVVWCGGKKNYV